MSTPRASEQISQQLERSQSSMDSTLPSCFNADALLPRLLFLVSPTCEICVTGAMSATDSVLSLPRAEDFRLYMLWLPVLEGDTPQAAEQVQERLPTDGRLRHFWDHDLQLSQAFHRLLQLGQRPRPHHIAWDIFLLLWRRNRVERGAADAGILDAPALSGGCARAGCGCPQKPARAQSSWRHEPYGPAYLRPTLAQVTMGPSSPYEGICSNLQALSPRIAARSASLKLGVPSTSSTAVLVHG